MQTVTETKKTVKSNSPQKRKKPIVKGQKRKNPVQRIAKAPVVFRVPECALHYMSALINPYDTPAGACVPAELFPLPSGKYKTFSRFKFNVGTNGIGFALARACLANDVSSILTTTSTSALTSTQVLNLATNQNAIMITQNPYPNINFSNIQIQSRLVGLGLRVKYVGQLMNRNGICATIEHPDHGDVFSQFSFDTMNSHPDAGITRVGDGDWDAEVNNSGPCAPAEFEFQGTHLPLGNNYCWGIVVSGIAGDLYEGELVQHFELIGSLITNKSQSHSDPQITGKVLESVKSTHLDGPLTRRDGPGVWDRFKSAVSSSLPVIGNAVARVIPSVGSMLGPIVGGIAQGLSISNTMDEHVRGLTSYGSVRRHDSFIPDEPTLFQRIMAP